MNSILAVIKTASAVPGKPDLCRRARPQRHDDLYDHDDRRKSAAGEYLGRVTSNRAVMPRPVQLPEPRLGAGSGLRAFAGGITFVISTPAVWGYALVPAARMLVLACGRGGLGVWGAVMLRSNIGRELDGIVGGARRALIAF